MKFILGFITIGLLSCFSGFGQNIAISFDEVESKKISIYELDEVYKSALHSDSTKAVFNGREEEFLNSYKSLLNELALHLKSNNFYWEKQTRCFNRIYINKDGEINYFIYNFKEEIEKIKEEEFKKLLTLFINTYKFPLASEVNFVQCSPVKFFDL
jgi:hypothetical protein